jgi:hypothetical protein
LAGWAIAQGQLLLAPIPAIIALGTLLMFSLSLTGWCVVLLLGTVVSRGVVAVTGLPDVFNFMHYPATLAFAMAASQRPAQHPSAVPARRWLAGLVGLTLISSILNLTNPLRGVMFLFIVGEPLLIVWAMQRWGVDEATEARVGRFVFILLLLEIPLGLWQGKQGGWNDATQGTLIGHGAGAHVFAGLFALALFVWLAAVIDGRHSWVTAVVVGLVAFGMMGAAGALQVVLTAGATVLVMALVPVSKGTARQRRDSTVRRGARKIVVGILLFAFVLSALLWADVLTPGTSSRAETVAHPTQRDEYVLAKQRFHSQFMQFVVGSGPGTSGSRAALLLTRQYAGTGSIFLELPIEPTPLAVNIVKASSVPGSGGSAESAASSVLGIIGDLGILGLVGLVALMIAMYRASLRVGSWLAPALAAALLMAVALSFIDNWLEYPEFSVPLAILIGLATSSPPSMPNRSRAASGDHLLTDSV